MTVSRQHEFALIEKYCETCGSRLRIKNTLQITRKKFCSRVCMGESKVKPILLPEKRLAHNRKNPAPAVSKVRELLSYDADTGEMRWLADRGRNDGRGGNCCAGKLAGGVSHGYWRIKIDGVLYDRSLLAWLHFYGEEPVGMIDHADLNKSNDAIENLRESSKSENYANQNCRVNNKSGRKGVYFNPRHQKWQAMILVRGKRIYLGRYDDLDIAAAAYLQAAKQYQGEFARA